MSQLVLPVWIVAVVCLVLQPKAVELQNETLVTTAYERLMELYIDGQMQSLANGDNWTLPDYTQLQPTNRLIAMYAANLGKVECGGVLTSVDDGSLITDNKWKCSPFKEENWTNLGFDDSSWSNASEYGSNGNHIDCDQDEFIGNINSNSMWIWTGNLNDFVAYCRGYLPFCENASPCLNDGTCLKNDQRFCDCLPQFTGTHCETELYNETLVITAYEQLTELYIDGVLQSTANGNNWNRSDYIEVPPMSRLIAVKANNNADPLCGGILASIYEAYALINSNWKCSTSNDDADWTHLGYNDSSWAYAFVYGSNVGGHSGCDEKQSIVDIDPYAQWIWTNNPSSDLIVYCRGYLPFCETKSPCLNNGTCLQNSEKFCECLPQYTGTYCEAEIPTTVETTESYTTEITPESYTGTTEIATEFTTEETSTLYTSDLETLSTTMIDISTDYTETTDIENTTENISTKNMETTDPPKTTEYLSTDDIETTDAPVTNVYLSTNSIETTNPTETTEYLSTDYVETTDPSETTMYLSTDLETTDPPDTTPYFLTDSIETTDPPETTVYLSTDSTETTHSPETTEYVSTDHTETTQQPETTESITNLETTWPSETSVYSVETSVYSAESKETTIYSEKSTESVTSEVASQTTATASTVVSYVRQTTDNVQATATTVYAGQTIVLSHSTADTDQTTSQEIDFSASTWFSEADNSSNTSPVIYGDCPEELFCDGPLEKPGSSIEHCSCPSGYLNLNGNCCLNQYWIIGLTCISVGIVIGILVAVFACLLRRRPPTHDDISDRLSLSVSHGGSLLNGKAIAVTESSLITGESELPSTYNNGYMDQYYQDDKVEAAMPVSNEKMHAMPLEESLTGIHEWEPAEKEQVRQDSIFNPMMIDVLSSETGRQFRPSLGSIATDVDFSIQRPSIQLSTGPYNNFYDDNLQF